jgi:hypothetical protein
VSKANSSAEKEEMVFLSTSKMQMFLTFRYSSLAVPLTNQSIVVLRYSNEGKEGRKEGRKGCWLLTSVGFKSQQPGKYKR